MTLPKLLTGFGGGQWTLYGLPDGTVRVFSAMNRPPKRDDTPEDVVKLSEHFEGDTFWIAEPFGRIELRLRKWRGRASPKAYYECMIGHAESQGRHFWAITCMNYVEVPDDC